MLMKTSAVVLLLAICAVTASEGMKCYTCTTLLQGDNCGDPFKSSKEATSCAQCMKSKTEVNGKQVIVRSCSPVDTGKGGCDKANSGGNTVEACFCKGDLCNTSSHVTVSMATSIGASALLLLFKTFF